MEPDTLKQWMSEAGVNAKDGTEGFWVVFSSNLEISVGYISDADVVVCFAPILELEGLNDAQRLAVLSRSLSLNGLGNLPSGCAISYEDDADVVYLQWQQSPLYLDSTRFAASFCDFEAAAANVQKLLQESLSEQEADAVATGESSEEDFVIKV